MLYARSASSRLALERARTKYRCNRYVVVKIWYKFFLFRPSVDLVLSLSLPDRLHVLN